MLRILCATSYIECNVMKWTSLRILTKHGEGNVKLKVYACKVRNCNFITIIVI